MSKLRSVSQIASDSKRAIQPLIAIWQVGDASDLNLQQSAYHESGNRADQ